jgi:hypothetical protein
LGGGGEQGDKRNPVNWFAHLIRWCWVLQGRSNDTEAGALFARQAIVARLERIEWVPMDRKNFWTAETTVSDRKDKPNRSGSLAMDRRRNCLNSMDKSHAVIGFHLACSL